MAADDGQVLLGLGQLLRSGAGGVAGAQSGRDADLRRSGADQATQAALGVALVARTVMRLHSFEGRRPGVSQSRTTLVGVTEKQWPDKTLDISGLRPQHQATVRHGATEEPTLPVQAGKSFQPGVAQVGGEPTLTFDGEATSTDVGGSAIQSRGPLKQPEIPFRSRVRQLRKGGRWSAVGAGILFFCWAIWAISGRDGDTAVAALALLITLAVGGFLFGLCRLLGFVVLERTFSRVRRSAWVSHAVIGVFFTIVGFGYLQRVQWIVDVWNWLNGAS